ncbi:hypothetical protein Bca52824_017920 [Brassica carinata]|uniref:Uncharacterized protein n=1 Tax=Brassica carinata TaxID=52824 RepID=A0A8X8AXZ2_BRACI|nr:hypothetical protein Bca52824_017920 [Brassica carinata]
MAYRSLAAAPAWRPATRQRATWRPAAPAQAAYSEQQAAWRQAAPNPGAGPAFRQTAGARPAARGHLPAASLTWRPAQHFRSGRPGQRHQPGTGVRDRRLALARELDFPFSSGFQCQHPFSSRSRAILPCLISISNSSLTEANPRRSFSSSVAETEKTKEDDDGGEDIGKCEVLWVSFSEVRISVLIGFSLVGSSADKDRQLGEAHADIKDLRLSERQREKAVEENLEIKKINEEKKASMAAQFAAEATLRRVHAAQKHEETNHL